MNTNISKALNDTLDEVASEDTELAAITRRKASMDKIVHDTESDVEYAREQLKSLIEANNEAIQTMNQLAQDSEHPRAYEVLAGLIKQAADMNKQLVGLQKDRKNIVMPKETAGQGQSGGGTTNTQTNIDKAVFVGTTVDLQNALKEING